MTQCEWLEGDMGTYQSRCTLEKGHDGLHSFQFKWESKTDTSS